MPEKTQAEREAIALGMWDNLGRVMAETFQLDRLLKDPSRFEFENPALISRYRDKTGPLVIAAPHMGNWEVGILPLHAINARPAGVYRIVENPYVDRWLRNKCWLFIREASSRQRAMKAWRRSCASPSSAGGRSGMLADLVDWKGIQVPFFGHMMWATIAPAWLARRAGTRLCVGRCIRIGKVFRASKSPSRSSRRRVRTSRTRTSAR